MESTNSGVYTGTSQEDVRELLLRAESEFELFRDDVDVKRLKRLESRLFTKCELDRLNCLQAWNISGELGFLTAQRS